MRVPTWLFLRVLGIVYSDRLLVARHADSADSSGTTAFCRRTSTWPARAELPGSAGSGCCRRSRGSNTSDAALQALCIFGRRARIAARGRHPALGRAAPALADIPVSVGRLSRVPVVSVGRAAAGGRLSRDLPCAVHAPRTPAPSRRPAAPGGLAHAVAALQADGGIGRREADERRPHLART